MAAIHVLLWSIEAWGVVIVSHASADNLDSASAWWCGVEARDATQANTPLGTFERIWSGYWPLLAAL